jgi:hypothetical protein
MMQNAEASCIDITGHFNFRIGAIDKRDPTLCMELPALDDRHGICRL